MNSQRFTQLCLRTFVVSIAASAVIGVLAIAAPELGWLDEARILATTATIAAASVCGLACGGCLQRGHRILPTAGLVLTTVSAVLTLFGIWADVRTDGYWYWRLTATLGVYAVACAHVSMLFMAQLAGRFRWAYAIAYQLILGLATLLALAVVFETLGGNEAFWRLTGSVSVLVAAVTLLVPVFHFMSRTEIEAQRAMADPLLAVENEIARLKSRLLDLEDKRERLKSAKAPSESGAR